MQPLVTPAEMQRCDRTAIVRYRIPGLLLMENAGRAVAAHILEITAQPAGTRVLVLCGRGNNGGDGFVVARHLVNHGMRVDVVLLGRARDVQGDARTNLTAFRRLAGHPAVPGSFREVSSVRALAPYRGHEIIVDALVGTGFRGAIGSPAREVIDWVNRRTGVVVAVDLPSGVDAGTGGVGSVAVRARTTVTMGLAKIGHATGPGLEHTGGLLVADIGIPKIVLDGVRADTFRAEAADAGALLPRRPLRSHKYSAGKALVIGGSRAYTGAPVMTAQSALAAGAGAVVLGLPASIRDIAARRLLEVMLEPVPDNSAGGMTGASATALRRRCDWADAVAVGPGLGLHDDTAACVAALAAEVRGPLVADADALTLLAGRPGLLRRRRGPTVLTPHTGELARLTGESPEAIESDRVGAARRAARAFRAVVVLKGAGTVTASPAGRVVVNPTGNPGMATAGAGDVLTGVIVSLAAQGLSPFDAAWVGAYLHGLAGDLACARRGGRSLIAGDITAQIPAALAAVPSS